MTMSNVNDCLSQILARIEQIEQNITKLNTKIDNVEDILTRGKPFDNTPSHMPSQIGTVASIATPEEKIKYLNDRTNNKNQEDLLCALDQRFVVDKFWVHNILNRNVEIYDLMVDIIYEFDENSPGQFFYAFPCHKNLFFWNHKKSTWAKTTKSCIQNIFLSLQKKIMGKYIELMSEDTTIQSNCVEDGELIFVDNFDKKFTDFKKALISKFV